MEDVIGASGRPRWIAYRVIFGTGETLHLDVTARGEYDTGIFAYYFIRRGERHGLRIVGSLKSGPALNLLAAYDKQTYSRRTLVAQSRPVTVTWGIRAKKGELDTQPLFGLGNLVRQVVIYQQCREGVSSLNKTPSGSEQVPVIPISG